MADDRVGLEHVPILGPVPDTRVGVVHAEDVAEVLQEAVLVSALRAAGGGPAGDEGRDVHAAM